ncbi:50S ribosomal protein P1 [Candidatus Pacearchaeota archaeon]|nr:50S ribosomal protein P1 [Candidatus Pacearchaeota archaeon]
MEYIYAALLLHKLGQSVTEDNVTKVIKAAGASVDEAKVKTMLASLQGIDIATELANASTAVAAAPAAAPKAEEKKAEEKPVESAAGLASLFG